jgi:hypothetical protein
MESLKQPHWEALTEATRLAFHQAGKLPFMRDYYLAGVTGLAIHLGHRFSVDLDFFSSETDAVNPIHREALRSMFNDPTLAITYDKDGTFAATWRNVGISFSRLSLYPVVQEPLFLEGIPLATIPEIGAMKLAAIIDRGTRKDLVDLYYVLQTAPLSSLFEVAAIKYARVRNFPVSAARALAYFVDAETLPMPRMLDKTPWSKMRKFLEQQAFEAGRMNLADLWEDR